MGFYVYSRHLINDNTVHYVEDKEAAKESWDGKVHLFGCNQGWLFEFLGQETRSNKWHIEVRSAFNANGYYKDCTFLIDLMPNQDEETSLYEITDIWGFSYSHLTPLPLRLRDLRIVEDSIDRSDFARRLAEIKCLVYEFLYAQGGMRKGAPTGTWNPPPRSSTNAPILDVKSLSYFLRCISVKDGLCSMKQ